MTGHETSSSASFQKYAVWVVFGLVLLNHGWTCTFGFVNDDFQWVEQAAASVDGYGQPGLHVVFFLRPVVEFFFLLNYLVAGSRPLFYHVFNLAFEALNTWLVWRLALLVAGDAIVAFLTAMFFTVHPSHPGAVAWVCGRAELISTACYLSALLQHHKRRSLVAAALFAVGAFARESAVSFPVAALWLDLMLETPPRPRWRALGLYGLVLGLYALARSQWTSTFAWQYSGLSLMLHGDWRGLAQVAATQLSAAAAALLEPVQLSGTWAALVLVLLLLLMLWRNPHRRAVGFAAGWICIALLPFAGWAIFQPRYAYLPGVGLALLLALSVRRLTSGSSWGWRWVAAILLAAAWSIASDVRMQRRNEQWRRNGVMSERVIGAVVDAAPHPQPRSIFIVDGIGPLRLGRDEWAHTPVLLYGFGEALRLRYADHGLDVWFGGAPLPVDRPIVRLRWDGLSMQVLTAEDLEGGGA
ncbi:MAG: hypothetical protein HY270_14860 [Deltaproteobacteria bacterium]|nr:hypothetical protein [Deltaproteobacteria bacterium]